jgi:hypothetical protein
LYVDAWQEIAGLPHSSWRMRLPTLVRSRESAHPDESAVNWLASRLECAPPRDGARCPTLRKLKEQTGNVYENKGRSQKVEQSRSQEVESRTREQGRWAHCGVFVNSSTLDPRLLDFLRRNKPGMSMKTKDTVKKSSSRGVKKSRVERESKVEPQPVACLLTPRLSTLDSSTLKEDQYSITKC